MDVDTLCKSGVTGDSGSEVLDHVCAAEPGFRLAAAHVQGARRRCEPTQKQRLVYISEQCLLWCPLRCEIPLFEYTIWYSFNKRLVPYHY
jgi:hypothetical protein